MTLNLDDRLVKELMEVTRARSRTEAVHQAIVECLRRKEGLRGDDVIRESLAISQ